MEIYTFEVCQSSRDQRDWNAFIYRRGSMFTMKVLPSEGKANEWGKESASMYNEFYNEQRLKNIKQIDQVLAEESCEIPGLAAKIYDKLSP